MIPRDYITEWRAQAPWVQDIQVEQDLIICRALVAIDLPRPSGPAGMLVHGASEALGIDGPEAVLAFDLREPSRAR